MKKNIFINIFVIVLSLFPAVVGLACRCCESQGIGPKIYKFTCKRCRDFGWFYGKKPTV